MLTGRVTREKEALLSIEVLGPAGKGVLVEAMIDTGYNGYLTLPPSLVAELGLVFAGTALATSNPSSASAGPCSAVRPLASRVRRSATSRPSSTRCAAGFRVARKG